MKCPIHKYPIYEDVNNMGYFCLDCQKYYSSEELFNIAIKLNKEKLKND
jgi:hypothetical protein